MCVPACGDSNKQENVLFMVVAATARPAFHARISLASRPLAPENMSERKEWNEVIEAELKVWS